jgi:hypothetical protein
MILTKKSLKSALQLLLLVRSLVFASSVQATEPSMSLTSVPVASEIYDPSATERTWNLSGDEAVKAKLIGFERSTLQIQRRNGNLYINSKRTPNHLVSEGSVYARLVENLGMVSLPSDRHFDKWIKAQKGHAKLFNFELVVLKTANGEERFPIALLDVQDRVIIQDALNSWKRESIAMDSQPTQPATSSQVVSTTVQESRDSYYNEQNRLLEQQVTYLAVASGVTDLWEVKLSNGWNDYQGEFPVVVTGRSSDHASNAALSQYPGRYVSTIRKLSNRF